jgi:hypothetical protein
MWPIHGEYQCRTCGRRYPVPWAAEHFVEAPVPQVRVPSFRSALLPAVVFLAFLPAPAVRAADAPIVVSSAPAAIAFARYTAGLEGMRPWSLETTEIDASLPKLKKEARLLAIRRLLPLGKPQYEVLETAGDETVRQRVIVRYLTTEMRAAEIPASAVAVTPANYRFHFKGVVSTGDRLSYIFQITPRKNREGLIKGELWLDGETGASVRLSGRLVKRPSIFLKRVDVTRMIALHDGVTEARVTHLRIAARLLGVIELLILERPCETSDTAPVRSSAAR